MKPASGTCELHKPWRHTGVPVLYAYEAHHVVPQAWQHFALVIKSGGLTPDEAATAAQAAVGIDRAAAVLHGIEVQTPDLFDPRSVSCCPTGHRNVHYWIVRLMQSTLDPSPEAARTAVLGGKLRTTQEFEVAYLALQRYFDAGYALNALREVKLYGYA